jgi:aspartate-semialdehyde dehydrogenase
MPMGKAVQSQRAVIVGATGLVGSALVRTLERMPLRVDSLVLLATAQSAGKSVGFRGERKTVEEFDASAFEGARWVFFSGKDGLSEEFCPVASRTGAWVIDNSSVFRLRDGIPLVVPEVNMGSVGESPGIIANPNCSTIQLAVALAPLRDAFGLERVIVSTYQSASGAGGDYLEKLDSDTRLALDQGQSAVEADSLAFNCLPAVGSLAGDGRFGEEEKLERELRKILEMDDLAVCATAVRVPSRIGHAESVVVETHEPIDPEEARRVLASAPGIRVLDDARNGLFPTPRTAAGTDPVWVGRIRRARVFENDIAFWVVADNLLKGAALNAVQIAVELSRRDEA